MEYPNNRVAALRAYLVEGEYRCCEETSEDHSAAKLLVELDRDRVTQPFRITPRTV